MSFGMPFEVWKTHMGSYRSLTTMESFNSIYKKGGIQSFWSGWQPKLVESFMKGEKRIERKKLKERVEKRKERNRSITEKIRYEKHLILFSFWFLRLYFLSF